MRDSIYTRMIFTTLSQGLRKRGRRIKKRKMEIKKRKNDIAEQCFENRVGKDAYLFMGFPTPKDERILGMGSCCYDYKE